MSRTFIETDDRHSLFYRGLRDRLQTAGVEIVDSPVDATATFSITSDNTNQRVLSVSARNVPTEYEVYYTVVYGVVT
ncbi:MAG: LPS assembly lipoprotein LptE, partial [Pseudomonadota bacterium]|nr:LPS assembly lipoprotein LptE [Pseudomonadota bacterium]